MVKCLIYLDSSNDILKTDFSTYTEEKTCENNSISNKIISIDDSDEPVIITNDAEKLENGKANSEILNKQANVPIEIDKEQKENNEVK